MTTSLNRTRSGAAAFVPFRSVSAVQNASEGRILLVVISAGLVAGLLRYFLPAAAGGGHGGELAQKIWFGRGQLSPLPTVPRAVTSIVIVGMGASLGREAAPKQFGALVASMLAQWASLPNSQRRLLSACGAGIAAVYNVPFGGAIFALEVLLGTISLPLVPPALLTSLEATAVSRPLLPNEPTYRIPFYLVSYNLIAWSLIAGPLIGLVSTIYVRLIAWADAMKLKSGQSLSVLGPLVVFAALGAVSIIYPYLLGNGKDDVQITFVGQLELPLMLVLLVLKPIATAACLGSGAPGGLFTPAFTVGALLGGAMGQMWLYAWPGTPSGSFAVIGACAVSLRRHKVLFPLSF